jgi:peptidoglycan hydrolase-like protein with peptidoglycan-binding domain
VIAAPSNPPTASQANAKPSLVPPAVVPTAADIAGADTYRRVQTALNQIGYGPIAVDGKGSKETADAIRRFELDNGLPLSGVADDAVVRRLVAIGALAAH